MNSERKVGILTAFPAPYRVPLFNALAEIQKINLTVLVTEMKGVPHQKWSVDTSSWKFRYKILPSIVVKYYTPRFGSTYFPINLTLPIELYRSKFDVVVTLGWTMLYSNIVLMMGKVMGFNTILWETSIPHPPSSLKQRLEPIIRCLIG